MGVCSESNEEIIHALRREKDTEVYFRCFYECYVSPLRLFFARKRVSPEDATELIQDVFFSVYHNIGALRQTDDFEAWLFRIALNAFRNHLEKKQAQKRRAEFVDIESEEEKQTIEKLAADILTPLDKFLEDEQMRIFHRALNDLPKQRQRVFYPKVVREMTNGEIAAALCITIGAVKAYVFHARQQLQQSVTDY